MLNKIIVHLYFPCLNLNYGNLRRIEIFKQINELSTRAHNQSRNPSNQSSPKQKIITILECFARNCCKLACFVPLLAICRQTNKKKVNCSQKRNLYKYLTSVLRLVYNEFFCNVSDALLIILAFYDVFN